MKELTVLKNDLLKELNDISKDFCNDHSAINSSYICDAITEYSDSDIDIYFYDRVKWFANNWQLVDEAIAEFGKSDSIMQDIASAQFLQNERRLYEDLENIIKILALDFIIEDLHITELEKAKIDNIFTGLENIDHNNKINDIIDLVSDVLKVENKKNKLNDLLNQIEDIED